MRLRLATALGLLATAGAHAALNGGRMADPVGWIMDACLVLTALLLTLSTARRTPATASH